MDIFDILGPVMVGPSSSHTAGAARIGKMARTLLGGEPMEPENQRELVTFVQNFKALYPKKTVWCYSGYTWEQLTGKVPCHARCEVTDELLSLLDVLVDGRFVEAEHDISLRFRGSRNQRLLDVPKSLAAGQPVWWQDEKVFSTHTMER